ncbi:MAG: DUF1508 domain-containing protein [Thiomonas sp.]|jgi:uncharacterized protein YegP (UPF0339 family)
MTHAHEARNGSLTASQQATSSNTPSPDFFESYAIKRDGLSANVYRNPAGQWAWRLIDSNDEEIGGGSGYADEGEAASDALAALTGYAERINRRCEQIMAAFDRGERPAQRPQPAGRDADDLARALWNIDAIVQSETQSLSAAARLARRAVVTARTQATGADLGLLDDLAAMLAALSCQANGLSDTVNNEADAVGCAYASDEGAGAQAMSEQGRPA